MLSPCKRCGICCLMSPCHMGKKSNDAFAICIHLSFDKAGVASCEVLALGINPFEEGCRFQHDPAYRIFEESFAKLKQYLVENPQERS